MTWAFEGFGNADLPGFANDDFLGLEDKDLNLYDIVHFCCLL